MWRSIVPSNASTALFQSPALAETDRRQRRIRPSAEKRKSSNPMIDKYRGTERPADLNYCMTPNTILSLAKRLPSGRTFSGKGFTRRADRPHIQSKVPLVIMWARRANAAPSTEKEKCVESQESPNVFWKPGYRQSSGRANKILTDLFNSCGIVQGDMLMCSPADPLVVKYDIESSSRE